MDFLNVIDKKKEAVKEKEKQEEDQRKAEEELKQLNTKTHKEEIGSFIKKTKKNADGSMFIWGNWFEESYRK